MTEPCRMVRAFVPALALLGALLLQSEASGQQGEEPLIIEHADSLVGMEIDGEQVKQLIGHVRFRQGRTLVSCDRAAQYLLSKKIALDGTVEVRDDSLRMVGSRGMYYSETKVAEAFDRVLLEDPSTTLRASYGKYFANEKKAYFSTGVYVEDSTSVLTSDELTYFRNDGRSIATGGVTLRGRRSPVTITGNRFEGFRERRYSRMSEHPRLVQIDTSGDGTRDTLVVTSGVMESFQDSLERLVATDSVAITRAGLAAEAGEAVFFTGIDSAELRRSPVIWYAERPGEDNQVSGDSVFLKLRKRAVETAYVRGRAFAIARADTDFPARFNQMSGQTIILHFEKKALRRIDVVTTATSLYYLFDGDSPNGINKTTGDRVTVSFVEGKIDRIAAIAGAEGQYVPERLVRGREREFELPGFRYRIRPGAK